VHALEDRRLPTAGQDGGTRKIENELKARTGKVIRMAAQMGATVTAGEVLGTIE
jgi:hypothetical protein